MARAGARGAATKFAMRRMEAKRADIKSHVRQFSLPFEQNGTAPLTRNMAALPGLKTMIVKTIAFDLDGTLIESASLVGEILNSMRLEKGLAPLGSDCYRVWSSRGGNYLSVMLSRPVRNRSARCSTNFAAATMSFPPPWKACSRARENCWSG